MKNKSVIILALVLVVLIGGSVFAYNSLSGKAGANNSVSDSQQSQSEAEEKAKDFTVYDGERNEVKFSDMAGKPIVVNFWATWCPPCKQELPYFNNVYKEIGNEVTFMMVNLTDGERDTVESVKRFVEENGYEFPVYFDMSSDAAYAYNISSIPMTVFIDKDGTLIDYHIGAMSESTLRSYIEKIS